MIHRVIRKQPGSRMCLVCGKKNPLGLNAEFFELDNRELVAVFTPRRQHQGYPGRLHGGIAASILDETIGRVIMIPHGEVIWGVTADFNIRYKKPIPIGRELRVVARLTRESSRLFEGTGEIILPNGEIAAAAGGKYFKLSIEKISDTDISREEWLVTPSPSDPKEFDL